MSPTIDSYPVKHVVEQATGRRSPMARVIAAALIWVHTYTGMVVGPKLRFAMDVADVDATRGALH